MSPTPTEARTSQAGLAARLPDRITRGTFALAVASLASEIGIIVTGGAVRLTGSGLGCPTWPKCTQESLTNTPEMGIHGYIEFGNRTLTFVLVVIAAATFLSLWRLRRTHRSPFWLSVGLLAGIPAQAVVGGIVVLTELDPWWVAGHFIVSSVMVAVATLLVTRIGAERRAGRAGVRIVDGVTTGASCAAAWAAFAFTWAAVYLGTVVTGTGPHGGDPDAPRHAFDPLLVTRVHVIPVYLLMAAALVLLFTVRRAEGASRLQRAAVLRLLLAIALQAAIGYTQHFTGLPVVLVILHMLGSALLVAAATEVWDRQRSRYVTAGPAALLDADPTPVTANAR
ncbi:COX15/CtaA family protein [Micrococcus sp. HG099]|uniref:COX15/CtaA family protein n=1 Tax=Micrococcus sp. HG099 TaxID=2969755 RepID=UPI00215AB514|nr:COX15/CtaA family protein [Micrococcus sp. HG099]MCR8676348.1 COX15/CtaA family protein [Micrococcus sp. HG099]